MRPLGYNSQANLNVVSDYITIYSVRFGSSSFSLGFQSPLRINNMFNFKDKIPKSLLSGVVYKFTCSNCNVTYIGKTIRHLKVRVSEHLSISPLTEKPVTMVSKSAIYCHLTGECNVASLNTFP